MEIEIDSKKNNPLLKRTEVYFTVKHAGEGTPNRELIRSELADKLNSKKENIIVNILKPGFGINVTTGYAKVYSSAEGLKGLENEHILKRNKLLGETKKDKKEVKTSEVPAGVPSAPETTPAEQTKTEEKPAEIQSDVPDEPQVTKEPVEKESEKAVEEPKVEEGSAQVNEAEAQPKEEKPIKKENKETEEQKE